MSFKYQEILVDVKNKKTGEILKVSGKFEVPEKLLFPSDYEVAELYVKYG